MIVKRVQFTSLLEKELKISGKSSVILEKNGSVKIWRIMNAAKKTVAQVITARSSPANVKIWFRTGRGGASV